MTQKNSLPTNTYQPRALGLILAISLSIPLITPEDTIRVDLIYFFIIAILLGVIFLFQSRITGYAKLFSLSYVTLAMITLTATVLNFIHPQIVEDPSQFNLIARYLLYSVLIFIIPIFMCERDVKFGALLFILVSASAAIFGVLQAMQIFWIQELTIYFKEGAEDVDRALGTMRGTNQFALLLVPSIFISIGVLFSISDPETDVDNSVVLLPCLILSVLVTSTGLLFTQSRGTIIPMIVSMMLIVLVIWWQQIGSSKHRSRLTIIGLSIFTALFVLIYLTFDLHRFEELRNIQETNLFTKRIPEMFSVFPILVERPFLGHGFTYEYLPGRGDIDNGLLQIFYHHGIIGIIIYAYIFIVSLRIGGKLLLSDSYYFNHPFNWGVVFGIFTTILTYIVALPIRDIVTSNRIHLTWLILIGFLLTIHFNYYQLENE